MTHTTAHDTVITTPLGPDNNPVTYTIVDGTHLAIESDAQRPNAYIDECRDRGRPRDTFPHGISLEFGRDITAPEDTAHALVVADTIQAFHEALEWVTVDGQRLADPHPEREDDMWDWLVTQISRVAHEYAQRWPAPANRTDP